MTLKHLQPTCLVLLILFHFTGTAALASEDNIDDRTQTLDLPASPPNAPELIIKPSSSLGPTPDLESNGLPAAIVPEQVSADENSERTADTPNVPINDLEEVNNTAGLADNYTNVKQVKGDLSLLGNSVEPGEAALLKWVFAETFAGNATSVPVLVVNGKETGPTLCLTAAIHGDELNGIEIVRRAVHEINAEKLSGAVIGVPIVNFQGFRRASRYLPDRRDLNRYFPGRPNGSYASRIAHSFFDNVIKHCDFLIDLHTGSLSRTNLPQIRANLLDPAIASLAEKMGPIVVLQSKGATGTLRRAAAEAGIPAVTMEAGAPNNLQKDAVEIGVKSIFSALSSLGLSPSTEPFWKRNAEPVFYKSMWIRTKVGGILFSKIELGDTVKKNTVLGLISDPISNRTNEIVAPFEGRVIGMALNQVMHPGYAAYHIGLKSSVKEAAQPTELEVETDSTDLAAANPEESLQAEAENSAEEAPEAGISEITDPTKPEKEPIEEMELPTIDK